MSDSTCSQVYHINEPTVVAEAIDGEVVVIHMDLGVYYSLTGTAAYLWQSAAAGRSVSEMTAGLGEAFESCPDDVVSVVSAFLSVLEDKQLLLPGKGERPPVPFAWDGVQPYADPKLEEFDDMQDLLLADPIHDFDGKPWPGAAG
jgi:hypothetical protein